MSRTQVYIKEESPKKLIKLVNYDDYEKQPKNLDETLNFCVLNIQKDFSYEEGMIAFNKIYQDIDTTKIKTLTVYGDLKGKLDEIKVESLFDRFPSVNTIFMDECKGITPNLVKQLLNSKKNEYDYQLKHLILNPEVSSKKFYDEFLQHEGNVNEFLKRAVWIETYFLPFHLFKLKAKFWFSPENKNEIISPEIVFKHHQECYKQRDQVSENIRKNLKSYLNLQ